MLSSEKKEWPTQYKLNWQKQKWKMGLKSQAQVYNNWKTSSLSLLVAVSTCNRLCELTWCSLPFRRLQQAFFSIFCSFVGDHRIILSLHLHFGFLILLFPATISSRHNLASPVVNFSMCSYRFKDFLWMLLKSESKLVTFLKVVIFTLCTGLSVMHIIWFWNISVWA